MLQFSHLRNVVIRNDCAFTRSHIKQPKHAVLRWKYPKCESYYYYNYPTQQGLNIVILYSQKWCQCEPSITIATMLGYSLNRQITSRVVLYKLLIHSVLIIRAEMCMLPKDCHTSTYWRTKNKFNKFLHNMHDYTVLAMWFGCMRKDNWMKISENIYTDERFKD